MDYGISITTAAPFEETAQRVCEALRQQGFGVLPCNVLVRAGQGETVVEAMNPQVMAEVTGQPSIQPVADEAAVGLQAALAAVSAAG